MNSARPALHETMSKSVQLSLLDRSRTRRGEEDALALRRTMARAQRAEEHGYYRFWVAEHHGVPGVASGSPAVLLAAVGAATASIRIGSGGVMLPNHPPFVVAEQFLMLEALYPGRVDLGVGRSLGFTEGVRRALRTEASAAERFPTTSWNCATHWPELGPSPRARQSVRRRRCLFSQYSKDWRSPVKPGCPLLWAVRCCGTRMPWLGTVNGPATTRTSLSASTS